VIEYEYRGAEYEYRGAEYEYRGWPAGKEGHLKRRRQAAGWTALKKKELP
jgi:hypothetical protein